MLHICVTKVRRSLSDTANPMVGSDADRAVVEPGQIEGVAPALEFKDDSDTGSSKDQP